MPSPLMQSAYLTPIRFMLKLMTIIAAALLCATSCSPRALPTVEQTLDSTRITTTITPRDTTLYVPPDSSYLRFAIECDSNRNVLLRNISTLQGSNITLTAQLEQLKGYSYNISIQAATPLVPIPFRYSEVSTTIDHSRNHIVVQTIFVEKELKWWQKTLMVMGSIFAIFAVVFTVTAIKNRT